MRTRTTKSDLVQRLAESRNRVVHLLLLLVDLLLPGLDRLREQCERVLRHRAGCDPALDFAQGLEESVERALDGGYLAPC